MLNEAAIIKKKSSMAGVGNYFSGSEQLKDQDFFNIQVFEIDPDTKARQAIVKDSERSYLKFELEEDGLTGALIVAEDCLFQNVILEITTR